MDLGESSREHNYISGVARTLRGGHTLSLLAEVGPMSASAAVNGCEVNGTRWVCLTEGLARASTAGHVVIVDEIGRAVVGVFLF